MQQLRLAILKWSHSFFSNTGYFYLAQKYEDWLVHLKYFLAHEIIHALGLPHYVEDRKSIMSVKTTHENDYIQGWCVNCVVRLQKSSIFFAHTSQNAFFLYMTCCCLYMAFYIVQIFIYICVSNIYDDQWIKWCPRQSKKFILYTIPLLTRFLRKFSKILTVKNCSMWID